MPKKEASDIKVVAKNRKAFHEFFIEDRMEAGLVLQGSEVKSLRDGKGSLSDAYAMIKGGEAWLVGAHIAQYAPASYANHEPKRTRKLLLHSREILKLLGTLRQKGYTMVPLMLYFRKGRAKVELGLARGKRKYDKRAAIRDRESKRELSRAVRRKPHD
ncbi:MAG: SsrA-binding protein SmpB [Proteobacteria bacterium]|nr:SsrA-binding protein SmpB [Pseudomonadota bacterium]